MTFQFNAFGSEKQLISWSIMCNFLITIRVSNSVVTLEDKIQSIDVLFYCMGEFHGGVLQKVPCTLFSKSRTNDFKSGSFLASHLPNMLFSSLGVGGVCINVLLGIEIEKTSFIHCLRLSKNYVLSSVTLLQ